MVYLIGDGERKIFVIVHGTVNTYSIENAISLFIYRQLATVHKYRPYFLRFLTPRPSPSPVRLGKLDNDVKI